MDSVMSTYGDSFNMVGDFNSRETSGKGLFINMGMIKYPGSKNSAIFSDDLPFICIM
jgi:hypothetical protein